VTTTVVVPTTPGFNGAVLFIFLRRWAVPEIELADVVDGHPRHARALRLSSGPGAVRLTWTGAELVAEIAAPAEDHEEVLAKVAALCDTTAESATIDSHLGSDPELVPLVSAARGIRIPGTTDRHELAVQALVGQQISMGAAALCAAKLSRSYGEVLPGEPFGLRRLFPTAGRLAEVDPVKLPMPRARGRALVGLAAALRDGGVDLNAPTSWSRTRAELTALPGIGPWTADYIGLRGMREPDILLGTDLVIKRELLARGVTDPDRWSPFRSYVTIHLWRAYV
jgi:AraC family transcriptional regulator of adaptative response / DNA-3-methyladenine glycosylase II